MTLLRLDDGGFRLEEAGTTLVHAGWDGGTWRVDRQEGSGSWILAAAGESGGLVLEDRSTGEPEEIGRTTPMSGSSTAGSDATLLTRDGRLFRIGYRGGSRRAFELTGWETPGAYLTAETAGDRWEIGRTPAGEALGDDDSILILFAATVADLRHD